MIRDDEDFALFSRERYLVSLRSSGYKSTEYAVAELVDNAIDADPKYIEIMCRDENNVTTHRNELRQIAVLDDGGGMNSIKLRRSLCFGPDDELRPSKRIGKFGVGLKNSSLSQCTKMEIYTWQNNSTPFYTYIDIADISKIKNVPKPINKDIPDVWKKASKHFSKKSGTLVIWSNLDQCTWKTSKPIIKNSEFLIGRLYRRYLNSNRFKLNLITFVSNGNEIVDRESKYMLPNDPLYLMSPSSTPEWSDEPMFKEDIPNPKKIYEIPYKGTTHIVKAHFSIVKDEVRKDGQSDPGHTLHGRHARKNIGLSIIRSDREIDLDTNLVAIDPTERWWGAEIEFPTSLDTAIGLTTNKQYANVFSNLTKLVGNYSDGDGEEELRQELKEHDLTEKKMFEMAVDIKNRIRSMQRRLKLARKGSRNGSKKDIKTKGDTAIKKGVERGETGTNEEQRKQQSREQRIRLITNSFKEDGYDDEEAKKLAIKHVDDKSYLEFTTTELSGDQFFDVLSVGGILRIKINSNHPAYKNLYELGNSNEHTRDMTCEERLRLASDGLQLLIASWARYEDSTINEDKKRGIQNHRIHWGAYIRNFLLENEN